MTRPDQERVEALRKALSWETVGPAREGTYEAAQMDRAFRAIVTALGITQMVAELRQLADGLNDNGMPETATVIHAHADMLAVLLAAGGGE